jgi:hypothetical protein
VEIIQHPADWNDGFDTDVGGLQRLAEEHAAGDRPGVPRRLAYFAAATIRVGDESGGRESGQQHRRQRQPAEVVRHHQCRGGYRAGGPRQQFVQLGDTAYERQRRGRASQRRGQVPEHQGGFVPVFRKQEFRDGKGERQPSFGWHENERGRVYWNTVLAAVIG